MTDDEPQDEPQTFDLEKWIAQKEDREHAIRVLMPESDEQADQRRAFITKVSGPVPNQQLAIRAAFHIERLRARMELRPVRTDVMDIVENLLDLSQSVKGWRADKIVEAHTGAPKQVRTGFWDARFGKKPPA